MPTTNEKKNRLTIVGFLLVAIVIIYVIKLTGTETQIETSEQQLAGILQEMEGVGQVVVYFHYEQQQQQLLTVTQQRVLTGVIVVAQGAHNARVQLLVKTTVGNVLQIPMHRIQVVAMRETEDGK